MQILPGILARDENDFRKRILHPELRDTATMFHVDILDGSMFGTSCWADPQRVGTWSHLPDIELHCMVANPLAVAEVWRERVPSVRRVIVHEEINRPLPNVVSQLRTLGCEVVVAANPTTPVDVIAGLPIDALLVMGVEPGASGQPFLGEPILAKLRRAKSLFPNLTLALDGGVSELNITALKTAGVDRCVATSALWKAENPAEAYKNLLAKVR